MRLLLVEDDPMIGDSLRAGLRAEGHALDWVRDATSAATALATETFDAVLLDLGLPGGDGIDVLRALRAGGGERARTPVLVITARDSISDRVAGLDAGADDYVVKPFDLEELAARLRAVARRRAGRAAARVAHGALVFDPSTRAVTVEGQPVSLGARELALLEALIDRPGAVLSRAQLEERIYGWRDQVESNAVEVHIHGLRRKIGAQRIRTIRGVGYMLVAV